MMAVRLILEIQATRRNDLENSRLCSPITLESLMKELMYYILGLIFSQLHRRIQGMTEVE